MVAPTVSGLSVSQGPLAGGTALVVTGAGFESGNTTVSVGGNACTSLNVASATSLSCVTPAGSAGVVDVTVTTVGGTSMVSAADQFSYLTVPGISSVSPASGPAAGGTAITLSGSGFVSGATTVSVGGNACTSVNVASATSLSCVAPAGSAGTVDITVTTAGGTSTMSTADHFTYLSAPTITSVSPVNGPTAGGTAITLTGTGFSTGAAAVNVGANACTSVNVASATSLSCVTPAGSAGTVDITVTTAGGTSTLSAADRFSYAAVPMVSAVSPASGPVAGNTTVTLTGSGFVNGATTVNVGGNPCTSVTVSSATSLSCVTPAGSAGTVDITVTTAGGTSTAVAADRFSYAAVPTVSAVSPASGPVAGNTTITLTGSGFVSGATTVNVGGNACTSVTVNSATSLSCVTPAGSAGAVDVTVSTAGGTSTLSAADRFSYAAVPTVSAVSPGIGPVAGNTTITLTGSGFVSGATTVNVGGNACTSVNVASATSLSCVTPAGSAGTVDITVTTAGGTSTAVAADRFSYAAVPTVSAVSPASGPVAGNTTVTLTGTGFVNGATTVNVGGNACTSVNVASATSLSCVTPAGSAGTVDITVSTAGGTSTAVAADRFSYAAVPTVSAVSPPGGPLAGGSSITVTGSGFVSGATTVSVGGNACTSVTVSSATSLSCVTPAGSTGTVDVRVSTAGGTSTAVAADRFSYANVTNQVSGSAPGGGGTIVATLSGPNGCGFQSSAFLANAGGTSGPPPGYTMPYGAFHFATNNLCSGGAVSLTLSYPNPLPGNAQYYKFGPTPTSPGQSVWYAMPGATPNANAITFQITDGALGDDDLSVNGIIVDDGGVVTPAAGGTTGIPTLGEWGLWILSGLLAVLGMGRRNRQGLRCLSGRRGS
ncbi:MAG: IPTL-CTERM sorting domain-containing protein [Curvibacter sp.]|nr:IPTL-CTERM sorting domain-containing protein [Curvibacter sp.]